MDPKETPEAPPVIAPWVLSLRFGLEVGSLIALGAWAHRAAGHGVLGWAAALAVPLVVAVVWGTFAVPGDPSRSGKAPVPVSWGVRLLIEMVVFLGGAAALAALDWWPWFDAFVAAFVVHHAGAMKRLQWLSRQK
jgi:hypothetical protein